VLVAIGIITFGLTTAGGRLRLLAGGGGVPADGPAGDDIA
jgi:hypothetical protein